MTLFSSQNTFQCNSLSQKGKQALLLISSCSITKMSRLKDYDRIVEKQPDFMISWALFLEDPGYFRGNI